MPAPAIYRSSDTNAPVLFGLSGSLISLLDAILVNGYGSAFATGIITNDGTAPSDGDTVTVGSITYTFRTSLTAQPAYTVAIGSGGGWTVNLQAAINANGAVGTTFTAGTLANPDVWCSSNVSPMPINARKGGAAGNSIALSRASAGTPHFSVSGATLTGGGGSDTKASVGWTKPFGTFPQAVYRQPAGSRFYLQVDDSGPGAGASREARNFGFESMTAYNVGTGQFPTVAQSASGSVIRKSSTLDNTARPWIAFADDRTLYLFTLSGDVASHYHGFSFGDFYSFIAGDAYKCLIMGGSNEGTSVGTSAFGAIGTMLSGAGQTGHWLARNYSGFGASTIFVKLGDYSLTATTAYMVGTVGFPNSDGGIYFAPLRITDAANAGSSLSGNMYLRGRLRGLMHICHPWTTFVDGDILNGSGAYAGRTFQVIKTLQSSATSSAFGAMETTAWEVSA